MLLLKLGSFLLLCVTFDVFMCDSPNPNELLEPRDFAEFCSVVGAFRTHLSCFS